MSGNNGKNALKQDLNSGNNSELSQYHIEKLNKKQKLLEVLKNPNKEKVLVYKKDGSNYSPVGFIFTPATLEDIIDEFGNDYFLFTLENGNVEDWNCTFDLRNWQYKQGDRLTQENNNYNMPSFTGNKQFDLMANMMNSTLNEVKTLYERMIEINHKPEKDTTQEILNQLMVFEKMKNVFSNEAKNNPLDKLVDLKSIGSQLFELYKDAAKMQAGETEVNPLNNLLANITPENIAMFVNAFQNNKAVRLEQENTQLKTALINIQQQIQSNFHGNALPKETIKKPEQNSNVNAPVTSPEVKQRENEIELPEVKPEEMTALYNYASLLENQGASLDLFEQVLDEMQTTTPNVLNRFINDDEEIISALSFTVKTYLNNSPSIKLFLDWVMNKYENETIFNSDLSVLNKQQTRVEKLKGKIEILEKENKNVDSGN